ncbi:sensor histidine kinase [Kitasatospora sp. NBC_00240]|uniref:sensor histidine kinase n=1 Tax=Kitasatospora sp. NBC_00240 TaxID=2903567 RepID=UPI00225A7D53|nr:sensor histidine kinase [Kitasatospora sp. NBC_00240]MCX5213064.1 sensor histidine kinase [Kitasatospora sp. NBC_00240]
MSSTLPRRLLAGSAGRTPWSAGPWHDTLFLAAGALLSGPFWVAMLVPKLLFPMTTVLLLLLGRLTAAQRSRLRALRGVEIPRGTGAGRNPLRRLRTAAAWRQTGYHLVVGPLLALAAVLLLYGWAIGLVLATVYGWSWLMPATSRVGGSGWVPLAATLGGAALLAAVPRVAGPLAALDQRVTLAMLGPDRAELLERRVEDLAESRAGVVDAADTERRRIERDLHDGAQQRLTSLAMNLGLARRTLKDVPPEAMQVIIDAHEEAQAAIAELRDLIRGLHPVVLEDRGLDAALSGIAARAPLPVRLDVDLPGRVSPTVEAVAYFTVSEALTNVAKHARASKVVLSVREQGGRLRIVITDDGVGGADPAGGTGLTGLRKRAASVDGTLAVHSPLGGPTTITVELPCEL